MKLGEHRCILAEYARLTHRHGRQPSPTIPTSESNERNSRVAYDDLQDSTFISYVDNVAGTRIGAAAFDTHTVTRPCRSPMRLSANIALRKRIDCPSRSRHMPAIPMAKRFGNAMAICIQHCSMWTPYVCANGPGVVRARCNDVWCHPALGQAEGNATPPCGGIQPTSDKACYTALP